ncbi:intermembrane transport protein PqiB [Bordetella holmesii]|uniref:Mce related family protein n=2 Tax=Bordetella holmesii TaxID=35814 RepID=A0ABN0RW00_9BORD|nr:MlaD family protein [Bordetella holmesii]AHV92965.1 mce related family protein [Bordetella holmesii ATCC 51541]AIT27370.1 mce related family protein [Bordetella holmesii 44057]EWM43740.1 mce related family protein [Bordetella holmesii 41130]EWM47959.1 mce related family protein [Bordetella holmesii 35009]EWM48934.1 mce related family protein [Bordetella holmesii 70147]
MAEPTDKPDTPLGKVKVTKKQRSRVSWIWLVPLVAALAGLSLVVRTWMQSGPDITIEFNTAEGLEVGKTQVRYKDVTIGTVKGIHFNEDRSKVVVEAELAKEVQNMAREGTNFWVVRPRLGISGVSGLGTLLSGAYIGLDASGDPQELERKPSKFHFVGLETPPPVEHDRPGKRFTLRASDLGSLDIGSPVYYRRISVGQVIAYSLTDDGRAVDVEVFVDAPNDRYVTEGARFWNASGVDFSVNAEGLKVRTQSLVSVAVGGVAFDNVVSGEDEEAKADTQFQLYGSEANAKANTDGTPYRICMRFDQSVRGLSVGAPVDFQGIVLGEVTSVAIDFDGSKKRFYGVVDATIYPERLGSLFDEIVQSVQRDTGSKDLAPGRTLAVLVKYGLRAQLRSANLLTGQMYVVLDNFPSAKPVNYEFTEPANIPTIPGQFDQLQEQIGSIVAKIEKIPFDQIGQELRVTLSNTSKPMTRLDKDMAPGAAAMMKEARRSMEQINELLSSDSPLQLNADRSMQELSRAARALRNLADYLQANPQSLLRGRGADPIPGSGSVRN